jgi:hypothetical protein
MTQETTQAPSTDRLWELLPKVKQEAETNPQFEQAVLTSPIKAIKERFGAAAMPNEGEYLRARPEGGFDLVFPVSKLYWTFQSQDNQGDELSDELLENVSAGSGAVSGPGKMQFS